MCQCEFCQNKVKDKAPLDGFPATYNAQEFSPFRPLCCVFSVIRKSTAILAKWIKPHNHSQASHWIAWLHCYLKRISMPRWNLWPLLCKTANRWNRWVAVWQAYSVVGSELPLNGAHFITLQITRHWPLNTHICKLSQRTMLLRLKYCLILPLQIKASSCMLSCSHTKRRS